jgi:hypothetical protein
MSLRVYNILQPRNNDQIQVDNEKCCHVNNGHPKAIKTSAFKAHIPLCIGNEFLKFRAFQTAKRFQVVVSVT